MRRYFAPWAGWGRRRARLPRLARCRRRGGRPVDGAHHPPHRRLPRTASPTAADGLGGGWDKAQILAIMKDSRIWQLRHHRHGADAARWPMAGAGGAGQPGGAKAAWRSPARRPSAVAPGRHRGAAPPALPCAPTIRPVGRRRAPAGTGPGSRWPSPAACYPAAAATRHRALRPARRRCGDDVERAPLPAPARRLPATCSCATQQASELAIYLALLAASRLAS